MSDSFVHLHLHSEFSLVDGIVRIPNLVKATKEQGSIAVAVTDHTNMFSIVKFYRKALASGVKPIIGADMLLRDPERKEVTRFIALCQNATGYRHLMELISRAYIEGQHRDHATVEWQWLLEKSEGLLILSAGRQGNIGKALLAKKIDEAEMLAQRWQAAFPDRFYVELQRTSRPNDEEYVHAAVELAAKLDLPVVATNDVRFLRADDFDAHEARVCIHDGYVLEDPKRPHRYSKEQYLKSPEQMAELFADIPEALENSVNIARRCNVKIELGKSYLPQFPIPEGMTTESYLEKVSNDGLAPILQELKLDESAEKEYHDRLAFELKVINGMGFPGYFLIVADFIQWAKEQGIPVGPGRGSGAGSLVAYVLGITELDPLEHELLFERFLNPERVSMPDFDIDFCMERRDEVIQYVAERYGREAVSQIITYGTMAARAVVRDVGRVLGLPYGLVDKLAKLVPFEIGMTLEKAMDQEEQLMQRYNEEDEVRTLLDYALALEGISRNAGKHAGGVLIAPTKLSDFTPLYCEPGGENPVSQFDKDDVEAVGLVKFDFLGLRTLTIIDWALQTINRRMQKEGKAPVDITTIPLDDEKSFKLLKACATSAVFQLESRGMKDLIRRLQPDRFGDITALVALFRPGPLQSGMVDDFIDRKHGRAQVEYPHPALEAILSPTYGVILYQEQVMQIAQVLASYSLGGADLLRRAMGKKKPEEMAKQRTIFMEGAIKNGIDGKVATHIFDLMEKFAGYGFNKSHSAAYALIAYRTAWLKAHYPAEFMAAVLSSDMDNTDKVVGFLQECKRMQVAVNYPDINIDDYHFEVNEAGQIEYGLGAIKGVGEAAIDLIIAERKAEGSYKDLFDLCKRLDTRKLNRRVLEALIKSGALDKIGPNRASMLASVDKALKFSEQHSRNDEQGQNDLFGDADDAAIKVDYVEVAKLDDLERLQGEKDTLGQYISGHPLQAYAKEVERFARAEIAELNHHMDKTTTIAGQIMGVKVLTTRTGKRMAIVTVEDLTGQIDVTVFSKTFDEVREQLQKDAIVFVKGQVEKDDFSGGIRMRLENLTELSSVRQRLASALTIKLEDSQTLNELLPELSGLLKPYTGGKTEVIIAYQGEQANTKLRLGKEWCVQADDELVRQLNDLCGKGAAEVEY